MESRSNASNNTVYEFKDRLKATLGDAGFAKNSSKEDQSARSRSKEKPHSHKPGGKLCINKSLFIDAYSKSKVSEKLSAKRFGPFEVLDLIGKNSV